MDDHHLLKLNPHRVIRCLDGIVSAQELGNIRQAINDNIRQLIRLAEGHLRFADSATGQLSWRQRVSRGYYACYSASKAVRLATGGMYAADVSDHKSVGKLPAQFPNKATWGDLLTKLRADRNIADYDHTESEGALEMSSRDYLVQARDFLREAKAFLRSRGAL